MRGGVRNITFWIGCLLVLLALVSSCKINTNNVPSEDDEEYHKKYEEKYEGKVNSLVLEQISFPTKQLYRIRSSSIFPLQVLDRKALNKGSIISKKMPSANGYRLFMQASGPSPYKLYNNQGIPNPSTYADTLKDFLMQHATEWQTSAPLYEYVFCGFDEQCMSNSWFKSLVSINLDNFKGRRKHLFALMFYYCSVEVIGEWSESIKLPPDCCRVKSVFLGNAGVLLLATDASKRTIKDAYLERMEFGQSEAWDKVFSKSDEYRMILRADINEIVTVDSFLKAMQEPTKLGAVPLFFDVI